MPQVQLIGVDVGTSRCRAVLLDSSGNLLAENSVSYPVLSPQPGWQEQDPHTVFQAFAQVLQATVRRASSKIPIVIGLSTYLNSLIPVDFKGEPLANCIIWSDLRSYDIVEHVREIINEHELYQRTGCPLHAMYPIWKILWFKKTYPHLLTKIQKWLSIKDFIIYKFCGNYITDWSIASASGMFNIHTLQWDDEALEIAEVRSSQLPEAASPLTIMAIKDEPLRALGLHRYNVSIVIGGGDGPLSSIGSGALGPHEADNTMGTGGAVRVLVDDPVVDKQMRTFCYIAIPGKWVVGGVTAGGLVYDWFIREWCTAELAEAQSSGKTVHEILEEYVKTVPPGSDGLFFLPFVLGSRTPFWNMNLRGMLYGLSYHHTKKHIIRALIEGLIYERFLAFQAVEQVVNGITSIRLSGSLSRSTVLAQIMADVYGRELLIPVISETSAFGAAIVAAMAIGLIDRPENFDSVRRVKQIIRPWLNNHKIYESLIQRYQTLINLFASNFTIKQGGGNVREQ